MSLRELWFIGPGQVELRPGAAAPLGEGQVRARCLASGISQGTELLLFKGEGPTPFDPSLDALDTPTFPRRYGYAWVGEVVESRSAAHAAGARLFGLLPHGDEHCVDATRVRWLPADLPAARAVLFANLETAVNVAWDSGVALGDDVLVIGGGIVGLLAGYAAKRSGARRVRLVESSARRRHAARALGFDSTDAETPQGPAEADVVIEASGNPACLDAAIACARDEGVVTVASFYGTRVAPVTLGCDFHRRRLTLRSSQVSRIPPARSARWSYDRRAELVMELLASSVLDSLLEPVTPIADAAQTYANLVHSPGAALQMVFSYSR